MDPQASKSTDKLLIIEQMIERLPVEKIKTITIKWEQLDYDLVPNLIIEMYEDYPETKEVEE